MMTRFTSCLAALGRVDDRLASFSLHDWAPGLTSLPSFMTASVRCDNLLDVYMSCQTPPLTAIEMNICCGQSKKKKTASAVVAIALLHWEAVCV